LLGTDAAKGLFVEALDAARGRHGFDVWAYVVMPEHVHLLLRPREEPYSISRILAAIKRPMSFRARRAGLCDLDRFWLPGGGFDRNIVGPCALRHEIEYIHANPVRRGLCEHAQEWRFSSARFWLGAEDVPLEIDRSLPFADPWAAGLIGTAWQASRGTQQG
jgi:putative transposase